MDTAVVQQAVGVLMDWYDISPDAATGQLQVWADGYGATIEEVAEGLVHGICFGRQTTCPTTILRQLEEDLRQLPSPAPAAGLRSGAAPVVGGEVAAGHRAHVEHAAVRGATRTSDVRSTW
ncbi:MAG: hypothetical protein QOH84_3916 [Kribbellaceae bacterium]|nr:hypothetical protein [Kribbellaceae bacterium]